MGLRDKIPDLLVYVLGCVVNVGLLTYSLSGNGVAGLLASTSTWMFIGSIYWIVRVNSTRGE